MNIVNSINNLKAYTPLMKELVSRDLKVKYRRSFLGYLWSLLNPLMMMAIMAFVFSSVLKSNIEHFSLYLIIGNTLFTFFNESTNMAMHSITGNGALIKKVYIPKYILPLASVLSSFVTMSFSFVAILIVMIVTRAQFHWQMIFIPIPLFFEYLFCVGVGLILASLSVYFRDINHLYGVVTMALMYATPIFYSPDIMSPKVLRIIKINPLYHYIQFFRLLTINGYIPELNTWFGCIASSLVVLVIGLLVFRKLQRNFILYL